MSSVSSIGAPSAAIQGLSCQQSRPADGDPPAKEAAESSATKVSENQRGGFAPHSSGLIDKVV
jgi:hypothetical protein